MFICQLSKTVSSPREKAVMIVLQERPMTYFFTDSEGEPASSYGREIVKEVAARLRYVDPEKAARIEASRRPPDMKLYEAQSAARFEHAAKCKKPLEDCFTCQKNIEFFASLPLPVLTRLTEERRFR
jgi:hypothetical protein